MENIVLPRSEYPRPRLMRSLDTWQCLNGQWEFEFDFSRSGKERKFFEQNHFSKEITVPFVVESKASGIEFTDFMESVWYRRDFNIEKREEGGRILLHFGAVNNYAEVWINKVRIGAHKGGYTPFTFDITSFVNEGENALCLHVENFVRDPLQPSGKQSPSYANQGCMYTRCTGIWQSVWLEYVPDTYIKNVRITPDVKNEKVDVTVIINGYKKLSELRCVVAFDGDEVAEATPKITGEFCTFSLPVPDAKLWDVDNPNLYDMVVTAGEDSVATYFGMRSIEIDGMKVLLNGKSIFQRLVLDQGYFEEGIYTAMSDEEFERDIALSKSLGFNGARMHMKVFEPGFVAVADRMGYLLWGEYPNWGLDISMIGAYEAIMNGFREEIDRDYSSPAIIGWCPLNELWTSAAAECVERIYETTKMIDPTRPVIDTSGWKHCGKTDIYDVHDYEQNVEEFKSHYDPLYTGEGEVFINYPAEEKRDENTPYFVSEFGGTFWKNEGNEEGNDQSTSWGYGDKPDSKEEFYTRLKGLCDALLDNPMVCGFCYTQFTDVMQEQNGLFTYSREAKFDAERIRTIMTKPAEIEK